MATSLLLSALCVSHAGIKLQKGTPPGLNIPGMPDQGEKPIYDPAPIHKSNGAKPAFEKIAMEKVKSGEVSAATGKFHSLAGFLKDSVAFLPKKKMEEGQGFKLTCPSESDDGCAYYVTVQKDCDCSTNADGGLTKLFSSEDKATLMGSCGALFTPAGSSVSAPTSTFRVDLSSGDEFSTYLTSATDSLAVWDGSFFKCTSLLSKKCSDRFDCHLPKDDGCTKNDAGCPSPKQSEECSTYCKNSHQEEL
eukprot:TRINITY_DN11744_c0_g1_i1.p1 TRINITY_DN11744_c0_g1~~TRINITY_DN11744_c0_g1_i1.p1  ORF type:complete len:249 (+),score=44.50 TRINITY_DN11744_c0_g1_i1:44-790(+)